MRALDILVVEDDHDLASGIADMLEAEGHRAALAGSGEAALEAARERAFDMIFLDVKLPGMTGIDALRELRETQGRARVVLMTGYRIDNLLTAAVKTGGLAVLTRPATAPRMREHLRDVGPGGIVLLEDQLGVDDKQVQAVIRAAGRGAELSQRLLAFSRLQPLQPKALDPAALVAGVSDLLSRTLGETIDIEIKSAADPCKVRADPGQLESALLDLAINSGQAMPDGGTLTIEAANATIDEAAAEANDAEPGAYVMVAVTDTGTGMSGEVMERAFEPFFTTKDVGEGSGLGLIPRSADNDP